jgi:putative ABC transport system permease protein
LRKLLGLLLIVRRSLRQHAVSTAVTVLSAALASGLVMAVTGITAQTRDAFIGGPVGFDAVLGARGSALQLVLNTVFHLETSPGNVSWELYQTVKADRRVTLAVPYAVGDNYRGFRIVGATEELFTKFQLTEGKTLEPEPGGRVFDPARREAVVGSVVSAKTGLRVGSKLNPYHGVDFAESEKHEEEYVVVGVLKPTNTPSDRVVWIPIDGIYRMKGHVLRGSGEEFAAKPGESIDDKHKEVSAVMLKFRAPQAGFALEHQINKQGKVATLAWPIGAVMADLFEKLGWMNRVLGVVSWLVVAVAAGSILASLYNAMNERRREFAILRALGAKRRTVFASIVLESSALAGLGAVLGFAVYAAIVAAAAGLIREQTGVVLETWRLDESMLWTALGMVGVGAAAGLVPAWKAYSTDVAENLAPGS